MAFLVDQIINNLHAMWETWVQSLDWEDLLEKGMAIHSNVLAWRTPRYRGVRLQSTGHKELDTTK